MAFDYSELEAVALELIDEFGRTVSITQKSRVPANATQPWRGTEPPGPPVTPKAVITNVKDDKVDGDLILRGDKMAVVASGTDLSTYDTLTDETQIYQIVDVQTIKPGDTALAYRLQLRR